MKAFLRLRNRSLNRMKVLTPSVQSKNKTIKKNLRNSSMTTTGTSSPVSKPSSPSKTNLAFLSIKLAEALMRGPNRRVVLRNRRLMKSHRQMRA